VRPLSAAGFWATGHPAWLLVGVIVGAVMASRGPFYRPNPQAILYSRHNGFDAAEPVAAPEPKVCRDDA
jgi:hypothetical protein